MKFLSNNEKIALFVRYVIIIAIISFLHLVFLYPDYQIFAAEDSYTLFTRDMFSSQKILPNTIPEQNEIVQAGQISKLVVSRNESEPLSFAIYNPSTLPLDDVSVNVSEITASDGTAVPIDTEIVSVKVLQKHTSETTIEQVPEVLIPYTSNWISQGEFDVAPNTSKQWIVSFTIPELIEAGLYKGTINVTPANSIQKKIPFEITVQNIILPNLTNQFSGFYYRPAPTFLNCFVNPCQQVTRFDIKQPTTLQSYRSVLQSDFKLLRRIGMSTIVPTIDAIMSWNQDRVTYDLSFVKVIFEEIKISGLNNQPVAPFQLVSNTAFDNIKKLIKTNRPGISNEQLEIEARENYKRLLIEIKQIADVNGITLYWYPVDEPFGLADEAELNEKRQRLVMLANLIKETIPDAKIWTTIHYYKWFSTPQFQNDYSSYIDAFVFNRTIVTRISEYPKSVLDGFIQGGTKQRIGALYLNYNSQDSLLSHRIQNGLFLHYLPVKSNTPWTYQLAILDPYNDTDGTREDVLFAYPDPFESSQSLPSIKLYAIREGIDDKRYIYALEKELANPVSTINRQKATAILNSINTTIDSQPTLSGIESSYPSENIAALRAQIVEALVPLPTPTIEYCQKKKYGDADCNNLITLKDYEIWLTEYSGIMSTKQSDFNNSGDISLLDYEIWRNTQYK